MKERFRRYKASTIKFVSDNRSFYTTDEFRLFIESLLAQNINKAIFKSIGSTKRRGKRRTSKNSAMKYVTYPFIKLIIDRSIDMAISSYQNNSCEERFIAFNSGIMISNWVKLSIIYYVAQYIQNAFKRTSGIRLLTKYEMMSAIIETTLDVLSKISQIS